MGTDCTDIMRMTNDLIEQVDEAFQRQTSGTQYEKERDLEDAISDNVRYFDSDRKAEIAEILNAILWHITQRILLQDMKDPFCNPQILSEPDDHGETHARLPQMEMLMRSLMPLEWALSAKWAEESFRSVIDPYLASYSPVEAKAVYDVFCFLFETFPEAAESPLHDDFMDYWRRVALERDSLRPESDEDKSKMLGYLLEKRKAMESGTRK